jgi:NADH-quinone oxidoreductase subunit I
MAFGLGVAKGMLTTISHLVKPPVTIQYPEERLDMPIWTRGRPRLIYEIDTGELRCTACGACALACPVDVIKIEQHPSPIKGKILDRFDIDMAGCIECALCVEACPFRAITMAPDFEMAATYDRAFDLVYDMYELRIPGTPEIDAGMEHIQGVKRGLKGQAAPAAPARPAAGAPAAARPAAAVPAAAPAAPAPAPAPAPAAAAPAAPAAAPAAAAAAPPADYDPLTISDEDLKKLPAADRAKVYRARLTASGWQPPASKA